MGKHVIIKHPDITDAIFKCLHAGVTSAFTTTQSAARTFWEVVLHVYKDPQQPVDSHSPLCVARPRWQNCSPYPSHRQKEAETEYLFGVSPKPYVSPSKPPKSPKNTFYIWAKQLTAYILRVCSTGAGPHAADGYHWTRGTRAEQARRGTAHTHCTYTNYVKWWPFKDWNIQVYLF